MTRPESWRMASEGNWVVDVGVHMAAALRLSVGGPLAVQAMMIMMIMILIIVMLVYAML